MLQYQDEVLYTAGKYTVRLLQNQLLRDSNDIWNYAVVGPHGRAEAAVATLGIARMAADNLNKILSDSEAEDRAAAPVQLALFRNDDRPH